MTKSAKIILFLYCISFATIERANGFQKTTDSIGKYCQTSDGTNIFYEVHGEGPPILLLHSGLYGHTTEYKTIADLRIVISKLLKQYLNLYWLSFPAQVV